MRLPLAAYDTVAGASGVKTNKQTIRKLVKSMVQITLILVLPTLYQRKWRAKRIFAGNYVFTQKPSEEKEEMIITTTLPQRSCQRLPIKT